MVRLQVVLVILLLVCLSAGPAWADDGGRDRLAMVEASISQIQAQIANLKSQLQAALTGTAPQDGQSQDEEGLAQTEDKDMLNMMIEFSNSKAGSTWDQLQAQDTQTGGPQGLEQFSKGFTDTPATGQYGPDGQPIAVGQAPSADQMFDLSAEMAKKKQAEAQAETDKQEALDKLTAADLGQWDKTLQQLEAARQQQNQQNQARADQLQQEAQQQMAQWQKQVSQGAMTEAEFQEKMDGMQDDHDATMAVQEQENQEFLADAFADLMDDPGQQQTVSALGWEEPPAPPRPAWMQQEATKISPPAMEVVLEKHKPEATGPTFVMTSTKPTMKKNLREYLFKTIFTPATVTRAKVEFDLYNYLDYDDGDQISIFLNGAKVKSNIPTSMKDFYLQLRPGPNKLTIKGVVLGKHKGIQGSIWFQAKDTDHTKRYCVNKDETTSLTITYEPRK